MGALFSVPKAKPREAPSPHEETQARSRPALHHRNSSSRAVSQQSREAAGRAVYVLGPSSSGKSTLCDALARYLGLDRARYVREVARTVMREQGFTRKDVDTYAMQHAIMTAQLNAEEAIQARSIGATDDTGVVLLSDRSAIDPIVYASTSKSPAAEDMRHRLMQNPQFQATLPLYRRSLFIVLQPVKEWIRDDGVRSLEDPWQYNKQLFATLEELNIPYVTIGADLKDIDSRVAFVATFV
ncbi:hypothetical protein DAEQUDRAFT_733789 [Daedalea quercina L-15889]|uniref:NadR/Ttd14 AAA domain-containing protein n=1 Tax=Daedalea quercina L-15889 TaxID=1314783 RepID=A0A165KQN4_9APHY|nr:hypothetical protein DAEQUDRAFT_733789 [Daedalea quercina L-15889]